MNEEEVLFTYLVLAANTGDASRWNRPLPQYWGNGEVYPKSTCFLTEEIGSGILNLELRKEKYKADLAEIIEVLRKECSMPSCR